MADLVVDGDALVVRLSSWERVGAVRRGDVRVPLTSITATHEVDDAYAEVKGLRAPGTGFPGRILLGTWRRRGAKDFVAVYRRGPGVLVELKGQQFARLIVTAPLPELPKHGGS